MRWNLRHFRLFAVKYVLRELAVVIQLRRDDVQGHVNLDVGVWLDRYLVKADLLDGFIDLDDLLVDLHAGELDNCLCDICCTNGTEEVPCIPSACCDHDAGARELVGERLGIRK